MEGDRGDPLEGAIRSTMSNFHKEGSLAPIDLRRLRAVGVKADASCGNIRIGHAIATRIVPDSYIFSASTEPDVTLLRKGQVIFEISDMIRFAAAVTVAAPEFLSFPIYGQVEYRKRVQNVLTCEPEHAHPFVKSPKFSGENEVRIVWERTSAKRPQQILRASGAAEFIRRWHPDS
jgi:hypothetical protein